MKLFILFYLLSSFLCQELNPLVPIIISSASTVFIDGYQNSLYAFIGGKVLEYDMNTYQLIETSNQIIEYIDTYMGYKIHNQFLFVGTFWARSFLYKIPLNNLIEPYQNITSPSPNDNVYNSFEFADGFVFAGTTETVEKYDFNTLELLESITNPSLNIALLIHNQSIFIAYGFGGLDERNYKNLSQLIYNYRLDQNMINTLIAYENFLLAGNDAGSIFQWNLDSRQLYRTLSNHTRGVRSLQIDSNFLFSGSEDGFWIQWMFDSGQIIRKVKVIDVSSNNAGVYKLLLRSPFLFVASRAGLYKYWIPEFSTSN